ncbi:hypothetical protein [Bacteroides uniformis]|uniref:hypothetical protein n=1 Tax=Bacteroides uniformis TaxID=820 RepID=UPI001C38198E|nr:hypothetical protein [Bacteroides uniformis]
MNFAVSFCSIIKQMLLLGSFRTMPVISEGVEYRNFIKWYRDNKKRLCESEMEEILLSLLMVTDLSKSNLLSSEVVTSQPSVEESNVVSSRNHALWLHGTCPT